MNGKKKLFRVLSMLVCMVLAFQLCSVVGASAEPTQDYPIVSNATQFLQAIAEAKDGDIIGISDAINFYNGMIIGDENKKITVIRESEEAFVYFSGTGSYTIQNIVFDGNEIESSYSIIYATQDITVKIVSFIIAFARIKGQRFLI